LCLYSIPEKASAYFLTPPEIWYSDKKGNTYTLANGLLTVRRISDNNGFLFKKGNSQNIYFWKNGADILTEASQTDWEKANHERNQFGYYDMNIELLFGEKISKALMDLKLPQGWRCYVISPTWHWK
ncbi:MAG: hypothetical protein PVI71_07400, partial [Desulfobacterales bacterium]